MMASVLGIRVAMGLMGWMESEQTLQQLFQVSRDECLSAFAAKVDEFAFGPGLAGVPFGEAVAADGAAVSTQLTEAQALASLAGHEEALRVFHSCRAEGDRVDAAMEKAAYYRRVRA